MRLPPEVSPALLRFLGVIGTITAIFCVLAYEVGVIPMSQAFEIGGICGVGCAGVWLWKYGGGE